MDPIEDYLGGGFRCGLRFCSCTASLLWTLSKTTSDEALDVVFDAVPALLLYYEPYRRLITSDEAFDVVFDTVSALLLYSGPYRRLPRMRLSMWSSILFLHCFFAIEHIEDYLG